MIDLTKASVPHLTNYSFASKTFGDVSMVAKLYGKHSERFVTSVASFKLNTTPRSEHRFTVAR